MKLCGNSACGALVEPKREFCSRACVLAVNGSPLTAKGRARGGLVNGERRRAKAFARLGAMSKQDVFTMGYRQGYNQGMRRKPRAGQGHAQ